MSSLEELLRQVEDSIAAVEQLEQPARDTVFELLDGIDSLHRLAVGQLTAGTESETLDKLRADDGAVAWLLDAYGIGVDQRAAAEQALSQVLPHVRSRGGDLELVETREGVVRLRTSGACTGDTDVAVALTESIETALREHVPGFSHVEVETVPGESSQQPQQPAGPVLVQLDPPRA